MGSQTNRRMELSEFFGRINQETHCISAVDVPDLDPAMGVRRGRSHFVEETRPAARCPKRVTSACTGDPSGSTTVMAIDALWVPRRSSALPSSIRSAGWANSPMAQKEIENINKGFGTRSRSGAARFDGKGFDAGGLLPSREPGAGHRKLQRWFSEENASVGYSFAFAAETRVRLESLMFWGSSASNWGPLEACAEREGQESGRNDRMRGKKNLIE